MRGESKKGKKGVKGEKGVGRGVAFGAGLAMLAGMEEVVRLYDTEATGDAWRNVRAPGGYEWWHFDAEGAGESGNVRVAVDFCQGWPLEAGYLARFAAYRRWPTRFKPPVAGEYLSIRLAAFEEGVRVGGFVTASGDRPVRDEKGNWRISLRGEEGAAGELVFRPRWRRAAVERELCPREWTGAEHRWSVVDPLCDVEGEIQLPRGAVRFAGVGYHDRHFGTGPLVDLRRWIGGRLLERDRAVMFQVAESPAAYHTVNFQVIEADARGMREIESEMVLLDNGRRYPKVIPLGATVLAHPRAIEESRAYRRVVYQHPAAGAMMCEVISGWKLGGKGWWAAG
jgi:hypothetical protein